MIHTLMALDKVKSSLQVNLIAMRPTFKALWTSEGPKCPKMGSKWAHFTRLCTPNGLG